MHNVFTYWPQCYRSRGQANEAAIAGVRLVDGVGVVVAELVDDLRYPVVVLRLEGIANETLELKCAAFALVVELIIKRFGNVGVHSDSVRRLPLHGAATDSLWSTRGGRRIRERPLAGAVVVASALHASSPAMRGLTSTYRCEPSLPPTRQVLSPRPTTAAGQRRSHTQLFSRARFLDSKNHVEPDLRHDAQSYRIYTQPSPS